MGAATGTFAPFLIAYHVLSSLCVSHSFSHHTTGARGRFATTTPSKRWPSISHQSRCRLYGKRPRSPTPAELDLDDSQVDRTTQLIDIQIDGVACPDDQDEKMKEGPSKSGGDLLKKLFLGIDPTPDIIAISTIYFVEGALGIARLAQTFLLKDDLHLGPAEMAATMGILGLPWTIKPLYGFLSDGFPIFGYRRRSYLILAGLVGFLSYSSLAWGLGGGSGSDMASNSMALTTTIISLLLSSGAIALADVVADGIVVEKTRDAVNNGDDPAIAGGLQSLCWGSAAIGGLISSYFSGSLLETMSPREVFGVASFLPLAVGVMSFLIEEEPFSWKIRSESIIGSESDGVDAAIVANNAILSIETQTSSLWAALRQPNIYKPIFFIFLWQATPTSEGAMLYFLTDDIGFGPEFLGRVRLVTAASRLLGVWLYNQYLRQVAIKDILLWTSLISLPLGLTQLILISHYNRELGIPDGAFVFGDDVALSILGKNVFVLDCAAICVIKESRDSCSLPTYSI
jgi:folate/biopterin transporter